MNRSSFFVIKVVVYAIILLSVLSSTSSCEALAAVNGLTLGGFEGLLALLAALYANCRKHLSCGLLRILLCSTALLASGGLVLKASLRIEFLLASCENKLVSTISALQCLVLVHFLFLLNGYFIICPETDFNRRLCKPTLSLKLPWA